MIVTRRADDYRRRAKQCLEMAAGFRDRKARVSLSHMAQVWLRLAETYEDTGRSENFSSSRLNPSAAAPDDGPGAATTRAGEGRARHDRFDSSPKNRKIGARDFERGLSA